MNEQSMRDSHGRGDPEGKQTVSTTLRPANSPSLVYSSTWRDYLRSREHAMTLAVALNPHRHKAPTAQAPRCSTQRAGITRPHAEGDGLSGVTSDRELNAFNSVSASFVGGMPLTRAMNPWAMPEAST